MHADTLIIILNSLPGRGLRRKTLFSPRLVSCLRYHLFLPSKTFILQAISKEKKQSFKPLCLKVNENCDFHFLFNLRKTYSAAFLLICSVSSSMGNKKSLDEIDVDCFFFLTFTGNRSCSW